MFFLTLSGGDTVNMYQVSVNQERPDGSLLISVIGASGIQVNNPEYVEKIKAIIEDHRPEHPFGSSS